MSVPHRDGASGRPLAVLCGMAFSSLITDLHRRLDEAGYGDLRPAHGFVFQCVAPHGATSTQIAEHLGITRQSTQQIVDELEQAGYLRREANPNDARSKLVLLTPMGIRSLSLVEGAFQDIDREWTLRLGSESYRDLKASLSRIAEAEQITGPLRPVW